jgi:PLP dependent protein
VGRRRLCYSLAPMSGSVADRVAEIRARIADAAARVGRCASEITLCAVTKTFPADAVDEAIAAGIGDVGENRVQEAEEKKGLVRSPARWHLIGHLQSNKARRAVELFDVVQSVDSVGLVGRLDRLAREQGRILRVYVEVDLAGEAAKSGIDENGAPLVAEAIDGATGLELAGLMAVPPYFDDPRDVRPYFRRLRELRDRLNDSNRLRRRIVGLSMGMSHDFEVAVEEGATLVRVGTAIFGKRD